MQINEKSSQLQSKTNQGIQKWQVASELMARPPKPPRSRSPPNPMLNRLRDESLASQHEHSIHVIDSRTKTLSTTHPDHGKYGTPPPRHPTPPPRQKKIISTEQAAPVPKPRNNPVPKPRNNPVPKPRSLPIPKPRNSATSKPQKANRETRSKSTTEVVDKGLYPVYI